MLPDKKLPFLYRNLCCLEVISDIMVCTPFLSKGLLLVATFHIIASYKFKFRLGTINRISAKSGDAVDIQDYFPTSGIETFITTVASRRMLLPTEYELSFEAYPVLKERYLSQKWPERDLHNDEDVAKYVSRENYAVLVHF